MPHSKRASSIRSHNDGIISSLLHHRQLSPQNLPHLYTLHRIRPQEIMSIKIDIRHITWIVSRNRIHGRVRNALRKVIDIGVVTPLNSESNWHMTIHNSNRHDTTYHTAIHLGDRLSVYLLIINLINNVIPTMTDV